MKSIEFSEQELNILLQLIDLAVKSGGLNVAEAAAVLARKLSDAGGQLEGDPPQEGADSPEGEEN